MANFETNPFAQKYKKNLAERRSHSKTKALKNLQHANVKTKGGHITILRMGKEK